MVRRKLIISIDQLSDDEKTLFDITTIKNDPHFRSDKIKRRILKWRKKCKKLS